MNIVHSKPRSGESAGGGPTKPTDIPRRFQDSGAGDEAQAEIGYVIFDSKNNGQILIRVFIGTHCL